MFIDFDLEEVLEILISKGFNCEDMTESKLKKLVPTSIDRKVLEKFYEETGLTVGHYFDDQKNERTLFFDRCGAFPLYDYGSGGYLYASGDYAKNDGDLGLTHDVIIEEEVQLISQTEDGKNYIIVPTDYQLELENDNIVCSNLEINPESENNIIIMPIYI